MAAATGPGVFDMLAGIVQALHGLASLHDLSGVELLFSADEEVGSLASRDLIEARALACGAVLVLEPSADGGVLKTGRKGCGTFDVLVRGRASHAGLEPEKGVNALVEVARQVLAINEIGRPAVGTTVTPTVANVGTADNVVPAEGRIKVDVRVESAAEKERVEAAMAGLTAVDPEASVVVSGGVNRPPMPESASAELMPLVARVAPWLRAPPWVVAATATSPRPSACRRSMASAPWAAAPTPITSTCWSTPCPNERRSLPAWSS